MAADKLYVGVVPLKNSILAWKGHIGEHKTVDGSLNKGMSNKVSVNEFGESHIFNKVLFVQKAQLDAELDLLRKFGLSNNDIVFDNYILHCVHKGTFLEVESWGMDCKGVLNGASDNVEHPVIVNRSYCPTNAEIGFKNAVHKSKVTVEMGVEDSSKVSPYFF